MTKTIINFNDFEDREVTSIIESFLIYLFERVPGEQVIIDGFEGLTLTCTLSESADRRGAPGEVIPETDDDIECKDPWQYWICKLGKA